MKTSVLNQDIVRYSPDVKSGLNDEQILNRKQNNLINCLKQKYSKSYWNIFTNNVCSFFNLLGLICLIALISTGAGLNQFVFVFFYVANTSIGIIQEIRAKRCIDKLTLVTNKGVKVIRNGNEIEIPVDEIVLDDVIRLGIGCQIPTDSIVIDGEIEVNEALLTGESVAVKKKKGDFVYAGSFVSGGTCFVKAEKVGQDNYVQTLSAKVKQYITPHSEIMDSLKIIIKSIGFIIVPIATAFMIKSLLLKPNMIAEAVLGSATVVIGMIPAGMFLLTSVALAVGIVKLAKHNTLVQDLYSLEILARVDTVCFDKTGTITDGNMSVNEIVCFNNNDQDNIKTILSNMLGAINDDNQTAQALEEFFGKSTEYQFTSILPFNSKRKLSAVTFTKYGTYAFGAPEFVVSKTEYAKIQDKVNEYANRGLRVLLVANSNTPINNDVVPKDLNPVALIIIADNV
ncbi:MAG: HAD-IC family P-type ATPase, partial [Clostridia bacterium]|nr:HAD-IC family P-type ATPase [Clostridia bacterium]